MTESRREVRATQAFFEELDQQLGDERGRRGEPSSYDFQSHELIAIVERFADDWDRLPELIAGGTDSAGSMPFSTWKVSEGISIAVILDNSARKLSSTPGGKVREPFGEAALAVARRSCAGDCLSLTVS